MTQGALLLQLLTTLLSSDLVHNEPNRLIHPLRVRQMRRPDLQQSLLADDIPLIADQQRLPLREPGYPPAIGHRLRVAVRGGGDDPVFDPEGEVLDGAVRQRPALAVAGGHELGERAAQGGVDDEPPHLGDARVVGAPRVVVGLDEGRVVDALGGDDGGAEGGFQGVGGLGPADGALVFD